MGEYFNEKNTPMENGSNVITRRPVPLTTTPFPQASTVFQTNFAALSLHQYDRIRLLQFPTAIADILRQTIAAAWPKGVQSERLYAGTWEYKLKGNPWFGQGDESVHACYLMQAVFDSLWRNGWMMSLSTNISKKQLDNDTMLFRHQSPAAPPCDWMSVSFARGDRLRLTSAPDDLREAIIAAMQPFVQESQAYTKIAHSWEIKLRGYPWMATGEETTTARFLMLQLVGALERFGFTVYACIDHKSIAANTANETDTWYCCRPQDWAMGSPVYHN